MRKSLGALVLAGFMVSCLGISPSYAGEIDILLEKLVEKGVVSAGESQEIKTQTQEKIKKENAQGKNQSLPQWLQTTKFAGDLRIRYQGETKTGSKHRDRGRFRLRYGFEARPNELMKVAFKMATGENKTNGPEQTSTNQTFTNTFQNKHVWVDQAYIEYNPLAQSKLFLLKDMTLTAGKFPNPFYTTDMVWDGDINPEGGVIKFSPKIASVEAFLALGFLPIGENSSDSNDPFIYAAQAGVSPNLFKRPSKFAVALYAYENIQSVVWNTYSVNYTPTINNTLAGTSLKYDYNILEVNSEYSPVDLVGGTMPLLLQGTWASNISKNNGGETKAWMLGFKLGKAKEKGTYDFFYNFREIGRDAVYAMVNDSDFHLGGTGAKGHKFGGTYAIMPNSTLAVTYFITDPYKNIQTGTSKHIDVYQVDWLTKF